MTAFVDDEITIPNAIIRVLEEAGVQAVFGMPGGHTVLLFDALYDYQDRVRAVLAREEGLAAIMAQVYGRLTGRPGVVTGQAAFLLAATSGILEGHLSGTPMLVLTDQSAEGRFAHHAGYQSGTGEYGSWDTRGALASMTSRTLVARGGSQTVQAVQLAVKHALLGGAVAVLLPIEALKGRVGPTSVPRLYATASYLPEPARAADAAALERAVALLLRAERPAIIAGNGVALGRAFDELRDLAETLVIPVATTPAGKGTFAETHDLALGVLGSFGTPVANRIVADADVVLVVGSRLSPTDMANENPALLDPERQAIIHIEIEPRNIAWTYPAREQLLGDARVILPQLLAAAKTAGGVSVEAQRKRQQLVLDARAELGYFDAPEMFSDDAPILPQRAIRELHAALPNDAFVCGDAGENRIFMNHYFQTKGENTYHQPAAVGAMGYAIPAAMAAKLVFPHRKAVAVCGDGGFGIGMNGLMTSVEEKLPITVVVFNNSSLSWVRNGQRERQIASTFADFDLAAVAKALRCDGIVVERPDELGPAFRAALASETTTVIDIRTSSRETFMKVTSPLARY